MSDLRAPAAISFDLGGTLLTGSGPDIPGRCRHLLGLATNCHEVDSEAFVAAGVSLDQEAWAVRDNSPFEYTTLAFIRLLRDEFGLVFDLPLAAIERELYFRGNASLPSPGVRQALTRLAAEGIPLVVVSNHLFGSEVLHEALRRHGMDHLFRFVISSADYGIKKPHPRIFVSAARRLGVDACRCWHVGDSLVFDVDGALSAGMTPVWYNPSGDSASATNRAASVRDWDALVRLVDAARAAHP